MKKCFSSSRTSPKPDFGELIGRESGQLSSTAGPRTSWVSPLGWFFFIAPPRLKPNCLLTRYPIHILMPPRQLGMGTLKLYWLGWQLQRHGYQVDRIAPEDLKTGPKASSPFVHLILNEPKLLGELDYDLRSVNFLSAESGDARWAEKNTRFHQLKLSWTSPLLALNQLLHHFTLLAEEDHQDRGYA